MATGIAEMSKNIFCKILVSINFNSLGYEQVISK